MSRDRDRARVALEFLGEWFGKGIEPERVAAGLLTIDVELLPIAAETEIDALLKIAATSARPGQITSPEGQAWLRGVMEAGLAILRAAQVDQSDLVDVPTETAALVEAQRDRPIEVE